MAQVLAALRGPANHTLRGPAGRPESVPGSRALVWATVGAGASGPAALARVDANTHPGDDVLDEAVRLWTGVPPGAGVLVLGLELGPVDPALTRLVERLLRAGADVLDVVTVRDDRWWSAAWPTDPLSDGHLLPGIERVDPAAFVVRSPADPAARRRRGARAWRALLDPGPCALDAYVDPWSVSVARPGPPRPEGVARVGDTLVALVVDAVAALEDVPLRDVVVARLAPGVIREDELDPAARAALPPPSPGPQRRPSSSPAASAAPGDTPGALVAAGTGAGASGCVDVGPARRRLEVLVRLCPTQRAASVHATRAAVLWWDGDTGPAGRAAARALELDRRHRLATLVSGLIAAGVHPRGPGPSAAGRGMRLRPA